MVVSINGDAGMKPLEEYMLYSKKGSETVRVTNPALVRSAQCAFFTTQEKGSLPPRNESVVSIAFIANIEKADSH